jgi:hypothetical protein
MALGSEEGRFHAGVNIDGLILHELKLTLIQCTSEGQYRTETRTLSSHLLSLTKLSSISTETSPGSTLSKSTKTSSGSTRLTSISLCVEEPSVPRGVVGVFGREPSPFFVGVPGTAGRLSC